MIKLSSQALDTDGAIQEMAGIHHQLTTVMRELPSIQEPELARRGLIEALQETIDNEFRPFFNSLSWQVDEKVLKNTNSIPPYAVDVIYHATREAVRNAAQHGRHSESDHPINLHIGIGWVNGLVIRIQDDGIGFDPTIKNGEKSGQGLALHSTLMAVVGGSLAIDSMAGKTQVILKLPA
jgi:signal transduction histidine kinase